jgi:protein phosphatase PTC1
MSLNKNYHFIQPPVINNLFQGKIRNNNETVNKNIINNESNRTNLPINNYNQIQGNNSNLEDNYNFKVNKILNELNYLRKPQNKYQNFNNNNNYNSTGNDQIAMGNINPNFNVTKNKFSMNFNLPNTINPQERVITFGQDKSENTFKKTLRNGAANLIQNNSYNIINHNSFPNINNNTAFNGPLRGRLNNTNNFFDQIPHLPQNSYSAGKNIINNYGSNLNYYNQNQNQIININSYPKETNNSSTNIYEKNASCVKEFSYKEDPNSKCRANMEDMSKIIDKFNLNPNMGLFAIFDGHGGGEIAKYLKKRLPEVISKNLPPSNNIDDYNYDIENTIINSFHKVDEEIKMTSESEYMGSTAVIVFISKERDQTSPLKSKKVIYCANVGDSRCVLVSNFGVKRLSFDHKASDASEIERVKKSGGIIFNGRVFGQLIITRAFGDNSLKRYGVIVTPYISKNFLSDKDKYIVLASDGVWDVIQDDELLKLSQTISNSDEFAKLIIKTSLLRGTQDNISCIVIKL